MLAGNKCIAGIGGLVGCAYESTGDREVAGSIPHPIRHHYFLKNVHKIFSTVILSILLIKGQLSVLLSVSGERMSAAD